jgi:hypothetical protein
MESRSDAENKQIKTSNVTADRSRGHVKSAEQRINAEDKQS